MLVDLRLNTAQLLMEARTFFDKVRGLLAELLLLLLRLLQLALNVFHLMIFRREGCIKLDVLRPQLFHFSHQYLVTLSFHFDASGFGSFNFLMHSYKSFQLVLSRLQVGLVLVFLGFQMFHICLEFRHDLLSVFLELAFSLFDLFVEGGVALFGAL